MATLFQPYSNLSSIELTVDCIIIVDILINFVSETVRDVEVVIYLREATLIYVKTYFIIDVLSILPSLVGLDRGTLAYPLKLFRFFRIKRFF